MMQNDGRAGESARPTAVGVHCLSMQCKSAVWQAD